MILTDRFMYILFGHIINIQYINIYIYIYTITDILSTQQTPTLKTAYLFYVIR